MRDLPRTLKSSIANCYVRYTIYLIPYNHIHIDVHISYIIIVNFSLNRSFILVSIKLEKLDFGKFKM